MTIHFTKQKPTVASTQHQLNYKNLIVRIKEGTQEGGATQPNEQYSRTENEHQSKTHFEHCCILKSVSYQIGI